MSIMKQGQLEEVSANSFLATTMDAVQLGPDRSRNVSLRQMGTVREQLLCSACYPPSTVRFMNGNPCGS